MATIRILRAGPRHKSTVLNGGLWPVPALRHFPKAAAHYMILANP